MSARRALAALVALAFAALLGAACAPILGLEDPGDEIDEICSCKEFNFAPKLAEKCLENAATPAHQSAEFLAGYVAKGPGGVACPDCTNLHECLARLELEERYIPCSDPAECAGNKCCQVPGLEHKTCCADCDPC